MIIVVTYIMTEPFAFNGNGLQLVVKIGGMDGLVAEGGDCQNRSIMA